jgi:hypothetical protein
MVSKNLHGGFRKMDKGRFETKVSKSFEKGFAGSKQNLLKDRL